jgi:glycosyltransferase involved in cell wall biosynthesis
MPNFAAKSSSEIVIAANNGDIGGGEVMLFNIAVMLEKLGRKVVVLAPSQPDSVALRAKELGLNTVVLEAQTRRDWLFAIRRWRNLNKTSLLWCNGLLPAFATTLQGNRIVHLHQRPAGLLKVAAFLARLNRPLTLVPSNFMAQAIRGSKVLYNWVEEVKVTQRHSFNPARLRVGFIGRLSVDKGILTLCQAMQMLNERATGFTAELVIAGEARFTSTSDAALVKEALESLGDFVSTIGWASPAALFEQIDVLVVPSQWQEPFGLVVTEAMSAGIPLICSDAGAVPEVAGFDYPLIFKAGDACSLADKINGVASELTTPSEGLQHLLASEKARWKGFFSPAAAQLNLGKLLQENNI